MQSENNINIEPSSFRDPSGFLFTREGVLLRQVNVSYQKQYEHLLKSGLYQALTDGGLLIEHTEMNDETPARDGSFRIIRPEFVRFISYPYEWAFGQYKDAALATLRIHRQALDFGMILKDASAYNIQFYKGRPCLIDTLSFDFYSEGEPWVAYGQFCRHFLAPLLLMAKVDLRLSCLMRAFIDGIPLDLASSLLRKAKIGFTAGQHIHLHAKSIRKHEQDGKKNEASGKRLKVSRFAHTAMIDSLIRLIEGIKLKNVETEWGDYYMHTNYSDEAASLKESIVSSLLDGIAPKTLWDLGANDGRYSRLASRRGVEVAAFDIDPIATERNYSLVKSNQDERMIPLILDLTNPSPDIGFANSERKSIRARQAPDAIMMLAVIHHLAISNNVPLPNIAKWLSTLSRNLIIEFVPKEDSQVKVLLATRADIFPEYNAEGFEAAFGSHYDIIEKRPIDGTKRTVYLMTAKG